ncbi:hypothetical protein J8V57_01230 [Xenorhabdus sp. PB61.4]|uniref:phage baseplate protein n=1 Tax=Xenorhabdus sp. PB61.4 TaxID=2788940 RepID=UPI001E2FD019|nr:hypothetical protein [Xenorhabdus sp. PB61.4]MCC8364912.1 hypothetical protein [Xenorhabdus sp. PB61.4]
MDILSVLFSQGTRKIGMIVPSVVISEKHQDSTEITEHPVQSGAAISDHAYDKPSEVTMELGFAGGGSLIDLFDFGGGSFGKSPKAIYQELLALKASKKPFNVTTGKRQYKNMLIRAIEVTTDKTSENVLMVTLTLREVIIVETRVLDGIEVPAERMKDPLTTGPVADKGTKTPVEPKNKSVIKIIRRGIERLTEWAQ